MAAALASSFVDEELFAAAAEAKAAAIAGAREDGASFCEYVLRHERTGKPITLAPMHEEWHELVTRHDRLIIWSHVEAGKTNQLAIGRTLFEIGRDTNLRIVIVGNTQGQAAKAVRSIGTYVERSDAVHEVFPGLKPSLPWTQTQLTVERETFSKDPSIQAVGVHGQVIGSRIDFLLVDDILDWENTRTPQQRADLISWWRSEIVGRLTENARVLFVGNAYVEDDLLHELAKENGVYVTRTYPVMDKRGRVSWAEGWSKARIAKVTRELGGEGHPEVARQLYCVPRTDASSRCQEEWIQRCLANGEGVEPIDSLTLDELAQLGCEVHIGVDIGVKKKVQSAKTVVFAIASWPLREDGSGGERQVLRIKSGRWGANQIVFEALEAVRLLCGVAHVEDNGAQDFILQLARGDDNIRAMAREAEENDMGDPAAGLLVLPFHTGGNKTHPVIGVESIFAEFARGRWIIPSRVIEDGPQAGKLEGANEEIREWLTGCRSHSPDRHTPDALMASWFAKEGARLSGTTQERVGAKVLGEDVTDSDAERPRSVQERLEGWEAAIPRKPGRRE